MPLKYPAALVLPTHYDLLPMENQQHTTLHLRFKCGQDGKKKYTWSENLLFWGWWGNARKLKSKTFHAIQLLHGQQQLILPLTLLFPVSDPALEAPTLITHIAPPGIPLLLYVPTQQIKW